MTSLDAEGLDPNELGDVLPEFLYRNRFEVVPVTVRPRPEKPRRAPRLGLEVAQVVSPPGQDIYCDALGRVCVRFRWLVDDQGHAPSPTTMTDEDSTCWLPVAQPWAGPGYGAQFIPRVGTEVLVGFLGGHGERPVVVGALHTEENPVPWSMPGANTKTGIRSRSTPKGEGWSEISIDDEKGHELLYVRAEQDAETLVQHDKKTTIGHDARTSIGRDAALTVGHDHDVSVGRRQNIQVAERLELRVGGDSFENVMGRRAIMTVRDGHDTVAGSRFNTTEGNLEDAVAGDATLRVDGQLVDVWVKGHVVVGTPEGPQ